MSVEIAAYDKFSIFENVLSINNMSILLSSIVGVNVDKFSDIRKKENKHRWCLTICLICSLLCIAFLVTAVIFELQYPQYEDLLDEDDLLLMYVAVFLFGLTVIITLIVYVTLLITDRGAWKYVLSLGLESGEVERFGHKSFEVLNEARNRIDESLHVNIEKIKNT